MSTHLSFTYDNIITQNTSKQGPYSLQTLGVSIAINLIDPCSKTTAVVPYTQISFKVMYLHLLQASATHIACPNSLCGYVVYVYISIHTYIYTHIYIYIYTYIHTYLSMTIMGSSKVLLAAPVFSLVICRCRAAAQPAALEAKAASSQKAEDLEQGQPPSLGLFNF